MIFPDVSGDWNLKEHFISFDDPKNYTLVQKIVFYLVRFTFVPSIGVENNKYRFYTMEYLDGPFVGYPEVVIVYREKNTFYIRIAESVDTGLTTVKICSIDNHTATHMEGVYQESSFLVNENPKFQKPKIAYHIFSRWCLGFVQKKNEAI